MLRKNDVITHSLQWGQLGNTKYNEKKNIFLNYVRFTSSRFFRNMRS